MFGKLGEIASQYLKKGSQAYFEGRIKTSKWQDESGNNRYTTEIVASEMQMLGRRADTEADWVNALNLEASENSSPGSINLSRILRGVQVKYVAFYIGSIITLITGAWHGQRRKQSNYRRNIGAGS